MDPLSTVRLAAIMEAATITGPAKNLIQFCRASSDPERRLEGQPLVDPLVITFVRGGVSSSAFIDALRDAGVPVSSISERYRFDPRVLKGIRHTIHSHQPHLVQTHNVKSHFLMRVSGLHRQYPWLAFHHGYTATDLKMRAYNQLDRWSLRAPRLIVTVCNPFADELERAGIPRSRIRILHNSVRIPDSPSPEALSELRTKLGISAKDKVVLAVGRFSWEKGFDRLLIAFARLRSLNALMPARLILAGDGPEGTSLKSSAEALGIADRVIFAGHVSDMQPYYGIADALALPSRSEGSPNVVLEAMAAGVPVAAAAVGGVPELVNDEVNGLLHKSGDTEGLAASIGRLLSDENLARRLSSEASIRIRREFQPDNYRRNLLNIYGEILS